jgi:hypothetical protein
MVTLHALLIFLAMPTLLVMLRMLRMLILLVLIVILNLRAALTILAKLIFVAIPRLLTVLTLLANANTAAYGDNFEPTDGCPKKLFSS